MPFDHVPRSASAPTDDGQWMKFVVLALQGIPDLQMPVAASGPQHAISPVLFQVVKRLKSWGSKPARPAAKMCHATDAHKRSLDVCVIGAGAAGLVAARELLREGHTPTVLEQGARPGGVWVYTDNVEEGGSAPVAAGGPVHSSMYRNLRTNLPREVMSYSDFPFTRVWRDARRFCGHEEVEAYLEAFAMEYGLHRHIHYATRVVEVLPWGPEGVAQNGTANGHVNGTGAEPGGAPWPRWQVTTAPTCKQDQASTSTATFDAVMVCNGHYSAPRRPALPGAELFPGRVLHSHSYRTNAPYAGLTVVVIGASASGEDISREIALVADKVYLCARTWQNPDWAHETRPVGPRRNIWRRPQPVQLRADGSVEFEGGQSAQSVDVVLCATGYRYTFPFLERAGVVTVEDNRVGPLYQHVFPPAAAPTLSFVGLPWKVVPFCQYELQSRWIARCLSGRARLPDLAAMRADVAAFYARLQADGVPQRYTHQLGDAQWEYNDWLAAACGPDVQPLPAWRPRMYKVAGDTKRAHPETYRDEWPETELVAEAAREAQALLAGSKAVAVEA